MKFLLNNRPEDFDGDQLTINQLLTLKNFTFRMMVIKVNGKLIKKSQRESTIIRDGDDVQVLHMISGG